MKFLNKMFNREKHYIICGKCNFERVSFYSPESDLHSLAVEGRMSRDRCPKCNYCGGFVGPYSLKDGGKNVQSKT